MAKKKRKEGPKTFPKAQGVEGEGDRFIPPDRQDQIPSDEADRPQLIQVKSLADDLEVVEDDSDEGDEGEGDREERREAADEGADRFEGDDEGEGEEEGDRDTRRHSRKVRARINRERTLTSQQRIRAENAERRARSVEDRIAKLERVTTEVNATAGVKELEAKLVALRKDLEAAIEGGKTAEQLQLTIDLGETQGRLMLLKRDLEDAKRKAIEDDAKRKEERDSSASTGAEAADESAPSADDYIAANKGWWNKPKFSRQRAIAVTLDTEILDQIASGDLDVEKYSEEHFEILNERLADLFPTLPLRNADGEDYAPAEEEEDVSNRDRDRDTRGSSRERQTGRRPPVGGQGTRNSGRRAVTDADLARQGKVKLGDPEYTTMRLFGLDPAKPEHKKAFAKERMRSIITDEKRRGNNTHRGAR